jgi:aconitase A
LKPGAGIIHQVVLENYAFPGGMMIGTDSYCKCRWIRNGRYWCRWSRCSRCYVRNGMGIKISKVIGVKLTGKFQDGQLQKMYP